MARSSEDTITESILMSDSLDRDDGSRGSSRPRSEGFTDEDEFYYDYPRTSVRRPSSFNRVLAFVGINGQRRGRDYHLHSSSSGEALRGLLARPSGRRRAARETRTCRKTFAVSSARRLLIFLPFVILMLFGVLHVIQSILGSAELLWDYDDDDLFLPDWGRPGHTGEGLADYPTNATRDVLPIPCHSHNDYWRRVPLFDALHWGCTSVEADVWMFDDDLFVGYNTKSLTRARSFRNLYIDPLVDLLDKVNAPGLYPNRTSSGVFDADPSQTFVLMVDIKSEAYATYRLLEEQLERLRTRDYLTYHDGQKLVQRAVTIVGAGNTPFDLVRANTKRREIFFDAPLDLFLEIPASPVIAIDKTDTRAIEMDYGTAMARAPANETAWRLLNPFSKSIDKADSTFSADAFNNANSYYASTDFSKSVGFVWRGQLSPRQMEIIRGQIRGAKKRQLKSRYFNTPVWPISARNHIWQVLVDEGADVLNVDDLKGAATEDWRRRVHRWWS